MAQASDQYSNLQSEDGTAQKQCSHTFAICVEKVSDSATLLLDSQRGRKLVLGRPSYTFSAPSYTIDAETTMWLFPHSYGFCCSGLSVQLPDVSQPLTPTEETLNNHPRSLTSNLPDKGELGRSRSTMRPVKRR